MTLTKADLVSRIYKSKKLTKIESAQAVESSVSYTHLTLPTICSV